MLPEERPTAWNHPHDAYPWLYWQLGRLVANVLRQHPEYIQKGRANLMRWLARDSFPAAPAAREWLQIIDTRTPQEVADLLEEDSEEAARLRSSSPFRREPFYTEEQARALSQQAHARR